MAQLDVNKDGAIDRAEAAKAPKLRKAAVKVRIGPVSRPARPPRAAAMPQVIIETRRTEIPISSAATGSCWAAWTARPEGERKKRASRTATTARTPAVMRAWTVTAAPHGVTKKASLIFGIVMMRVSLNSQNCRPMAVSATPAVPTRTVTLEALRSGWMTSRSVASPIAIATTRPKTNASG